MNNPFNPDECKTLLTALKIARSTILNSTLPALGMNAQARGVLLEELTEIDALLPKIMDLRYCSIPLAKKEIHFN